MPGKTTYSSFLKENENPRDWGIAVYLEHDHGNAATRKVLEGWVESLDTIKQCTDGEFSRSQQKRAAELMRRYTEKGNGSDGAFGRKWLSEKTKQPEAHRTDGSFCGSPKFNTTGALGPVFNAENSRLVINLTSGGAVINNILCDRCGARRGPVNSSDGATYDYGVSVLDADLSSTRLATGSHGIPPPRFLTSGKDRRIF